MLDSLFAPSADELQRALRYESARQQVVAHNIANVNTPGYQAKSVFRTFFSQAKDRFRSAPDPEVQEPFTLAARKLGYEIRPLPDPPLRPDGNNVNLEKQMLDLADAELRYRALAGMTTRYFQGLKSVIGGGRR